MEWKGWLTLGIVGVGFVCMLLEVTGPDFIMLVRERRAFPGLACPATGLLEPLSLAGLGLRKLRGGRACPGQSLGCSNR